LVAPYDARKLNGLRAVVLGGGTHIEPSRYQQTGLRRYVYDIERDEFEWRVLRHALENRLPTLGICRGAHLLNVFYGGTLYQDLFISIPGLVLPRTVLARRRITIEPESLLARATGISVVKVNSLHQQGVARVGRGLRVSARDDDGIVQAIESSSAASPFLLGVQWHPEYLQDKRVHQRLFSALVRAARGGDARAVV
jgi:putative glutamine amidotransferase